MSDREKIDGEESDWAVPMTFPKSALPEHCPEPSLRY